MTSPPPDLRLSLVDGTDRLRIEMVGDLDHDNAEHLLDQVTEQLGGRPHLKDLHLHCAGLRSIDSMGLSVLLMIGRRTAAAGIRLHLEDRLPQLNRLLDVTGTLDYFTASSPTIATPSPLDEESVAAARPTGPEHT